MAIERKLFLLFISLIALSFTNSLYVHTGINEVAGQLYYNVNSDISSSTTSSISAITSANYSRTVNSADGVISNPRNDSGFERLKNFLLNTSLVNNKNTYYVVYDFVTNCSPLYATYKIRFFYCKDAADAFYDSLSGTNKLKYNGSITESKDGSINGMSSNTIESFLNGTNSLVACV